jgi:L-seryl-tRNA(Ser) seleniumtransferase
VTATHLERLGVKPVINACGIYTDLGGSILAPSVWAAMEESNRSFVSMVDLLEQSGRRIAELVGAEGARVTPGASAAIALGTAACLAGTDGPASERLPEVSGPRRDVLIQRRHHYKYESCVRLAGARLVEVGDEQGTTLAQLEAALGDRTAMVLFPAYLDGKPGTVPLPEVVAAARGSGVPTFVDAAYENDPPSRIMRFAAAGDLACFSAKYFYGPNSGGFVCGRRELVDAVASVDFTRHESGSYRRFGRAFKLDRQIVVGTVVALEEWIHADHQARWKSYSRRVDRFLDRLGSLPGVAARPSCFTMDERLLEAPVNCAALSFDRASGLTAAQASAALAAGEPKIATVVMDGVLVVAMETVLDGQELAIAQALRSMLAAEERLEA